MVFLKNFVPPILFCKRTLRPYLYPLKLIFCTTRKRVPLVVRHHERYQDIWAPSTKSGAGLTGSYHPSRHRAAALRKDKALTVHPIAISRGTMHRPNFPSSHSCNPAGRHVPATWPDRKNKSADRKYGTADRKYGKGIRRPPYFCAASAFSAIRPLCRP